MYKSDLISSRFLPGCDINDEKFIAENFQMVIFGGGGDLSQKKLLPALYELYTEGLIENFQIISLGRTTRSDVEYRNFLQNKIKENSKYFKLSTWQKFSKNIFYISFDIENNNSYENLAKNLTNNSKQYNLHNLILYLAIPPNLMQYVVHGVKNFHEKLLVDTKIILEKPFGSDQKTAHALNVMVNKVFTEKQIYRIDHYLGKETVQNILFFRYANTIFEPLWNRNYIDSVQITVAETIGIEERGKFYEQVGIVRDVVQNHLMQLIAMIAMEPPVGFSADLIRNERVKIFQAMRPIHKKDLKNSIVLAQYTSGKINKENVIGYRDEDNVAKNSLTPTFFAGKFFIDNWRFANVPFYVRAGKRLAQRQTKIVIQFKMPPLKLLGRTCDVMLPNRIVMHIQPEESIAIQFSVKRPGTISSPHPVSMNFCYDDLTTFTKPLPAYNRLLLDCMKVDQTLFARADEIDHMWHFIDTFNKHISTKDIKHYTSGSWGPYEADILINKDNYEWID